MYEIVSFDVVQLDLYIFSKNILSYEHGYANLLYSNESLKKKECLSLRSFRTVVVGHLELACWNVENQVGVYHIHIEKDDYLPYEDMGGQKEEVRIQFVSTSIIAHGVT